MAYRIRIKTKKSTNNIITSIAVSFLKSFVSFEVVLTEADPIDRRFFNFRLQELCVSLSPESSEGVLSEASLSEMGFFPGSNGTAFGVVSCGSFVVFSGGSASVLFDETSSTLAGGFLSSGGGGSGGDGDGCGGGGGGGGGLAAVLMVMLATGAGAGAGAGAGTEAGTEAGTGTGPVVSVGPPPGWKKAARFWVSAARFPTSPAAAPSMLPPNL